MIVLGLILGGRAETVSATALLVLLYLGFLSAAAYSLWGVLLKHNPVSKVVVFSGTTPLFGVLISAILPENRPNLFRAVNLIALVVVCAGTMLVNSAKKE